ncbi:MAG TPA: OmpA family protein [Kofleriaceae bacterium]|nr:OmpA family protein [Kofleriaceae bacterium]
MARTSSPSTVLIVGKHNRKLERDLASAGHDVETVNSPGEAKRKSYGAVVSDPQQADESRATFGDSVIVASGDPQADARSVEGRVGRKPTRTETERPVIAKKTERTPIAAGPPQDGRAVVATKDTAPETTPVATKPVEAKVETKVETKPVETTPVVDKPKPDRVATTTTKPVEDTKPVVDTPKPDKPAHATKIPKSGTEVFFSVSSTSLSGGAEASLKKTAKWMTDHADVSVTIEGHADATGSHDANQTLSEGRAQAAKEFLVAQGVDASRIEVIGYGDTKPKYSPTDGRNRRVVVVPK